MEIVSVLFTILVLAAVVLAFLQVCAEEKRRQKIWTNRGVIRIPTPNFLDEYGTFSIGEIHGSCYDSPELAMRDPLVVRKGAVQNVLIAVAYYDNQNKERRNITTVSTEEEGLFELPGGDKTAFLAVAFAVTETSPKPNDTATNPDTSNPGLPASST